MVTVTDLVVFDDEDLVEVELVLWEVVDDDVLVELPGRHEVLAKWADCQTKDAIVTANCLRPGWMVKGADWASAPVLSSRSRPREVPIVDVHNVLSKCRMLIHTGSEVSCPSQRCPGNLAEIKKGRRARLGARKDTVHYVRNECCRPC